MIKFCLLNSFLKKTIPTLNKSALAVTFGCLIISFQAEIVS